MQATGSFEVNLEPQTEDSHPVGRLLIDKIYSGEMIATGKGQMISKRTESGTAVYAAIEEVTAELGSKTGGFCLLHNGAMSSSEQSLKISIIDGSGFGQLASISGDLIIEQTDGKHHYRLNYEL
jgi:hypothetical protein